ncbi:MAG: SAM-dependent DNA methyltransferase, partial [Candidatus Marinimicrobia bacterium]|nr:SAM-dependent DNA methyltransferase [Candidatus Neomarinimicrobiota bacterium]
MARSTVHYADNETNRILKQLHRKLRPAGTPVQRVEYIIELLLLRIFEVKLKQDKDFKNLRKLFIEHNGDLLFSALQTTPNNQILNKINRELFPFYSGILTKAGKVFQTNLPQKVQDQLVLIEEVFSNSNFTNNVKSGNLQEIISLVSEIDENRLLKTDLLGDAIESALSETGGTRDIGLFRTPDHIRQFMVGLIQPNFNDTVFDPACGTGGFLFDAFGYVIESVYGEGKWPGLKGHKELQYYFKSHFKSHKQKMPDLNTANNFYRTGVRGIEYLGMIRKMAAINFYIRGLNPQNIEQGDSLANYDPAMDGNSKSVVLANPPFGAERDQDAYPNVWENYSTESETTILFVKLMLDSLKPGGRCAVVVSEGFLTWDQNSARALRKMLLQDTNLKAIISLPQGVFVSKNGQGPKTSILVFEKGIPTKNVWFYKVKNDGYSMGTNRKEIAGCQLVEVLELWEKYVKNGKQCPDTKHSFFIPAEWILRLDPRVKAKIRTETRQTIKAKGKKDREKLKDKLTAQLKKKKIGQIELEQNRAQFNLLLESKIQNETAKRIEKAHLFSFNLPNYKSDFADSQ